MDPTGLPGNTFDEPGAELLLDANGRGPHAEAPIVTATGHVVVWLYCPGAGRAAISVGMSTATVPCGSGVEGDPRQFGLSDLDRTELAVSVDITPQTPWRLRIAQISD